MWYTGTINILSHSEILFQYCKVLQDIIIDLTKDSIYGLTSDVLEFPCTVSSFYVAGGVSFLLVLNLWYGGMRVVHHDVHIFVLQ